MFFHLMLFFSLFSYGDFSRQDVQQNSRSQINPVMTQNGCVNYQGFRAECKRGGFGVTSGN
jgi:hypothetical protein